MSSRMCNQCGCTDIDVDSTRGDAVCTGCGSVLEDQIIVSEVQFQENSGGGSSMIGQFVSSEGPKSMSIGGAFPHGMQKESRTITLQNGKKRIQTLAAQMKLNQHSVDTAFNFFKMAVNRRMTQGRKTTHVIAACLYLVCRTERTPHMLLDFSDVLQVNVYSLGKTYLVLSRELCINLPDVDPCLYISRFAHALEFGEKTHEVSLTAMRLVQRMKRDWMHTGRRPSGLCGAALLVAARIHDFSRTLKEIIKVVKVCQSTLRKRLSEFQETPSSQLTIEEFQKIDLEEEHDPPCYTEGKRKAKKMQELSQLPEYASEVSKIQEEIENTLKNQKPRGIWAAYAKMSDDTCSVDSDSSRFSELDNQSQSSISDSRLGLNTAAGTNESDNNSSSVSDGKKTLGSSCSTSGAERVTLSEQLQTVKGVIGSNVGEKTSKNVTDPDGDESNDSVTLPSDLVTAGVVDGVVPEVGAEVVPELGISHLVKECLTDEKTTPTGEDEDEKEELDLEGLDDNELDKFLLTEKEIAIKTKIWMNENADYLQAMKEKEERLAREKEEEAKKPEKKRKTYKRRQKVPYQEASTAQEAIQKILQERKISTKINYDVLNDLNIKSSVSKTEVDMTGGSVSMSETDVVESPVKNIPQVSRLRKAIDIKSEKGPTPKRVKLEHKPFFESFRSDSKKADVTEVVVESGPVQYEGKDDEAVVEEDLEEEELEGEEEHLSAAQLFGRTAGDDEYDEELD